MNHPKQQFRLSINVRIEDANQGRGALSVSEEALLTLDGFMGVAKVLSEFHDLVKALEESRK